MPRALQLYGGPSGGTVSFERETPAVISYEEDGAVALLQGYLIRSPRVGRFRVLGVTAPRSPQAPLHHLSSTLPWP